MRLWSLHPRYLDVKGLVALWREALLAQAVLSNETCGYKNHPQLLRFKQCVSLSSHISQYLHVVYLESMRRGYRFDKSKVRAIGRIEKICVSRGQIDYEWKHLKRKLKVRAPELLKELEGVLKPKCHPLFRVITGPKEEWEVVKKARKRQRVR